MNSSTPTTRRSNEAGPPPATVACTLRLGIEDLILRLASSCVNAEVASVNYPCSYYLEHDQQECMFGFEAGLFQRERANL